MRQSSDLGEVVQLLAHDPRTADQAVQHCFVEYHLQAWGSVAEQALLPGGVENYGQWT